MAAYCFMPPIKGKKMEIYPKNCILFYVSAMVY